MKKLTKFLTSASIGISMSSVIFLIKDYVYDAAMKEHEIFTILIAIFVPLFAVGTLLSVLLPKKFLQAKASYIRTFVFGHFYNIAYILEYLSSANAYAFNENKFNNLNCYVDSKNYGRFNGTVYRSVVWCNGKKRCDSLYIACTFCRRYFCFKQIYARTYQL